MKYFAFSSHDKVIFPERTATLFAFGAKKSEKKKKKLKSLKKIKNFKFEKKSDFANIFLQPFETTSWISEVNYWLNYLGREFNKNRP